MTPTSSFRPINPGYRRMFTPNHLSLGLVVPIEHYPDSAVPTMQHALERIQLAETLGFAAVWLRDVPFNVPSFGDAGQMFDPFVYLGLLAGQTRDISLCTGSIVLPLRDPAHVAKAAASVDVLSNGRLVMGIASGDRPEEYPALNREFSRRGEAFRHSYDYIRRMAQSRAEFDNPLGSPCGGMDMLPKPACGQIPMLITGGSQQHPDWIAEHGDGWITYPRAVATQARIIDDWRSRILAAGRPDQPASQSLYIDLVADADATPEPIHLGFRSGINALRNYLESLQQIGINHVALNLRFNRADIPDTLHRIADELFPEFS